MKKNNVLYLFLWDFWQIIYKPGSVLIMKLTIAIHLESLLLMISSNLPRWWPRLVCNKLNYIHLYMVLLLMGFTLPNMLPYLRWALTSPFQPYHLLAVFFLLYFPLGYYPSRGLPGTIVLWSPDFPLKFQRLSNNLPY